mgnify:FL=1
MQRSLNQWTILAPDRKASQLAGPRVKLIGRLPAEAYLAILAFLPVPDIPAFALASRKLAELTRDDRLWRTKLALLNYRGPGAIAWNDPAARTAAGAAAARASIDASRAPPPAPAPLFVASQVDDEFGDFFDGEGDVALVHDDGFGEFQDFDAQDGFEDVAPAAGAQADPLGLGEFSSLSVGGAMGAPKPKSKGGDDLMMLFDDDDDFQSLPP